MNEKQKRTIHCSFDVTPEEAAIIQQKMKAAGIKNKSQFFRTLVLNGYVLRLDLPELKEATRLMGILSNDVNQIARRVNEKGNIYETEMDEIVQKQNEIVRSLRQIYEWLFHIIEQR